MKTLVDKAFPPTTPLLLARKDLDFLVYTQNPPITVRLEGLADIVDTTESVFVEQFQKLSAILGIIID